MFDFYSAIIFLSVFIMIIMDMLVNGINKTIFATADDELRPVMNGIYINLAPGALTFVGTDAHKLVKYEAETENEVTASFILPKKPANLLKSVLLKEDDAIEVSFDSKNAMFKLKSHTLVCRLIEGNYPHHGAVMFGHYGKAFYEVVKFLGLDVKKIGYNQPAGVRYPTENPWG